MDKEEIEKTLRRCTERDIDALIEIGNSRNVGGLNRTMLDESRIDKESYVLELDDETIEELIARFNE